MRSKQERNQIITSEEKGRLRNHCLASASSTLFLPPPLPKYFSQ